MLVFLDADDCCGDATRVKANYNGKRDDKRLVAEQSPPQVRQVTKYEEAGNTRSQVDHTDDD